MKAKINRGGGFRGVVSYVHEKGDAEIVGGNMSGQTIRGSDHIAAKSAIYPINSLVSLQR